MTKRKTLLLAIAALLLFWLWPRTAMPDMGNLKGMAVTVIEHSVIHGVPQSDHKQYALTTDSPAYEKMAELLAGVHVHRSLQDLWYDGTFPGVDVTILLLGSEAMTIRGNTLLIDNHLYSGYRPGTGAVLTAQILDLLADVPPLEK